MGCRSRGLMMRRSGCLRGGRRLRSSRCRWQLVDYLGFRWPEQAEPDDLDVLTDDDGIVCLPSVLGERSAADRLQKLLARAFGGTWSPGPHR